MESKIEDMQMKQEEQDSDQNEFSAGLTIQELIGQLQCIKSQYGNIHVATFGNKRGQWHGLNEADIRRVGKNLYKDCYEDGDDENIVIIE